MKITENVYSLESTKGAYAYLINTEEPILIDTGFPNLSSQVIEEISALGINPKDIKNILLTHHDIDHIGNAKDLQEFTGAKLWASKEDTKFIHKEKNRPIIKRIIENKVKPKKPQVNENFEDGQDILGIKVIFTPGHTPGHVCFLYKKVLFIGDLYRNENGEFKILSIFTWNKKLLLKSIQMVKLYDFDWICPAHGEPIKREDVKGNLL